MIKPTISPTGSHSKIGKSPSDNFDSAQSVVHSTDSQSLRSSHSYAKVYTPNRESNFFSKYAYPLNHSLKKGIDNKRLMSIIFFVCGIAIMANLIHFG